MPYHRPLLLQPEHNQIKLLRQQLGNASSQCSPSSCFKTTQLRRPGRAYSLRLAVSAQQHVESSVVITGASSGIGKAAAIRLANDGWCVFAGVRRDEDAAALRSEHVGIVPVSLDVADPASVSLAAKTVKAALGDDKLDALINNAGISLIAPLELIPEDDFVRVLDINVTGVLRVTQQFLPMIRKSKGRIINMGSQSGTLAYPGFGAYSCSKFALEAFTDTLRMEMAQFGVKVSHINPGAVDTAIWQRGADNSSASMSRASSSDAYMLYSELNRQVLAGAAAASEKASSVDDTNAAILHALTSPNPRTRYIVGQKATILMRTRRWILPDTWFDWLVLSTLSKY